MESVSYTEELLDIIKAGTYICLNDADDYASLFDEAIKAINVLHDKRRELEAERDRLRAENALLRDTERIEFDRLRAENNEFRVTLKWLDTWLGAKPMTQCSERIRSALAKERQP